MIPVRIEITAGEPIRRELPGPTFRVFKATLILSMDLQAQYVGGQWKLDGDTFTILRIESLVTVHFEKPGERSETYGPLDRACIVDGVVRCVDTDRAIAAYHSPDWLDIETGRVWPAVVFSEPQ